MSTYREFVVEDTHDRLDIFLARQDTGLTRSQVRRLTEDGHVLLNGVASKPSRRLRAGDRIGLTVPPPTPVNLAAQPMPLNILYQDEDLLVVDKPAGLTVHPAPGHPSHTLVNAILALCPDLKGIGGEVRPGIVHRLDKDTSGVMVVAKSGPAHANLSAQIKERTIKKAYLALACGRITTNVGVIDTPIGRDPRNRKRMAVVDGGRNASTSYNVLAHLRDHSYIEVLPKTGRTHQIRVHFASIGHPLFGDCLYGKRSVVLDRQFLHSHLLGFHHPTTGNYIEITSPLPSDLRKAMEVMEGDSK